MICQATYDSLDAIPEALRDEFEQVKGKWQLKVDAIPGVGPLFNSGLAANEQKAVDQAKRHRDKAKELQLLLDEAQDKLSAIDTPGHKILSGEDAKLFDSYVALGTPKEIETKLTDYESTSTKVRALETKETMSKISESAGLNAEVLTDWATSSEGTGLSFFTRSVEQTDAKGVKTTVDAPFVKIEKVVDGKTQVEEKELLPFAKETLPTWKYEALTSAAVKDPKGSVSQNTSGVRLPNLGSVSKAPEPKAEATRAVDKFNKQRADKPNPFANPMGMMPTSAAGGMGKVA